VKEKNLEACSNTKGIVISALHARSEKDDWVIDSGCSNHMIGDKSKFIKLEKFDGGVVRFGGDEAAKICGKGSISFDGKHNTNDVLYVKGLKHNLLSVGYMCNKGCNLMF